MIEKGKWYVFNTIQNTLTKYNGTLAYVAFPLLEIGIDSCMYRVRFTDGKYEDVYGEELNDAQIL